MNKKLSFLLLLPTLTFAITSCKSKDDSNSAKKLDDIQLAKIIPVAYIGEPYNFGKYFIQEEGYTYNMEAYYHDVKEFKEYSLPINNYTFTPVTLDPVSVVLSAFPKGHEDVVTKKTVLINVNEKADPMDELLVGTGYSGYSDPGFRKSICKLNEYVRTDEGSKTSLAIEYLGNDPYVFGGAVLTPDNFRCQPLWKDKTWANAILRFWVYNDMDYEIEFGLRIVDALTGTVDIDMGQEGNPTKKAATHTWTEILFPLRPLGVTHNLYKNEEGTRDDSFTIKAKYLGAPEEDMYSYSFYVDCVDVVPASDYKDIITALPDINDRFVNSTWKEHFERDFNYDPKYIHDGESSIRFDFVGPTAMAGSQGMCLNDPKLVRIWTDQNWDNAILAFWMFNDSENDIEVQMYLKDDERNFVVDWNTEYSFSNIASPGQWTQIFFSLNRIGVNSPLYKDNLKKDEFNIKFLSHGPINTPYTFYVDDVDVVPASKYPEVDTTRIVPVRNETIQDGWENMIRDEGWEIGDITTEASELCTITNPNSAVSKKISFTTVGDKPDPQDFVLCPEDEFKNTSLPNFSNAKLEFDVKYSANVTNREIRLKVIQKSEGWDPYLNPTVTPVEITGGNGWYHASIDFSILEGHEALTEVVRIGFFFSGIDDTIRPDAHAYIDNIIFTQNAE